MRVTAVAYVGQTDMMRFEYQTPDGATYQIEAPNEQAAMSIIQRNFAPKTLEERGAVAGPAPDNTPIPQGDWNALAQRLQQAEEQSVGPMRPQDRQAVRQMEARRQGQLYGAAEGGGRNVEAGINAFANTAGLGLPQLMEAYIGQSALPGADAHEFIKSADAARYEKNQTGALAGRVGGALTQAVMVPYNAPTAAGRIAQASGAGAALSAGDAAVRSRGDAGEIAKEAAIGGAFGLGGGAIGEGIGAAAQGVARTIKNNQILRNAPTEEALNAAKNAGYGQARSEGLVFKQPALESLNQNATAAVRKYGEPSIVAPQASRVLGLLDDASKTSKSLDYVESNLRQTANNAAGKLAEGKDFAANRAIVGSIDDFYKNVTPNDIWSGDAGRAIAGLQKGRKAANAQINLNDIKDALKNADINAAASGTGTNIDNATRQAFKPLAKDPDYQRGFTKPEIEQLNRIIEGGPLQNILRNVGKVSPTGIVSTAGTVGTAYAVGDLAGLTPQEKAVLIGAVMAGGYGSRKLAETIGRRNVDVLKAMVTSRGVGQAVPNPAEVSKAVEAFRRAIATTSATRVPTYTLGIQ